MSWDRGEFCFSSFFQFALHCIVVNWNCSLRISIGLEIVAVLSTLILRKNVSLWFMCISLTVCRQQSDIARLEAKVERLEALLQQKDREIATITRTVSPIKFQLKLFSLRLLFDYEFTVLTGSQKHCSFEVSDWKVTAGEGWIPKDGDW